MKVVSVFLGVLAASVALHIPSKERPDYVPTTEIKARSGSDQYIYCYDQPNCYGTRITINTNPVPDLGSSPYYFDNRIESCNYNGIYILYDGRNYNQDNLNVSTNSQIHLTYFHSPLNNYLVNLPIVQLLQW